MKRLVYIKRYGIYRFWKNISNTNIVLQKLAKKNTNTVSHTKKYRNNCLVRYGYGSILRYVVLLYTPRQDNSFFFYTSILQFVVLLYTPRQDNLFFLLHFAFASCDQWWSFCRIYIYIYIYIYSLFSFIFDFIQIMLLF